MAYLMARPLLGASGTVQLWVGVFGVANAPAISFDLDGKPWSPQSALGLFAIRDDSALAGQPLNHQGVYTFAALGPDIEHRIHVKAGAAAQPYFLRVKSLPASLPQRPGTFKIMLLSCYCARTDGVDVGRFVQHLPVRPDMSLFAGDQVYLDQPPMEQMPSTSLELRRNISAKYQRNWLSEFTGQAGLQQALAIAPALCLPDDHEYWNNYPWPQFWKKGTQIAPTQTGLNPWDDAARELFQDYQLGGAPGSQRPWTTLDVDPLCMLFLDTRSHRQPDFDSPTGLMPATAEAALRAWEQKLLAQQAAGNPRIGVLATGQALFRKPAILREWADAELANYERQFAVLIDVLDNLAGHGIQVVFLTGDVHWGRVSQAVHTGTGRTTLSEVICSPSSLCEVPLLDQWASLRNEISGIFGNSDDWYRHSRAEAPPAAIGDRKQFRPVDEEKYRWKGNQVAMVEFARSGSGVEMTVSYHLVTAPPSPPSRSRPYTLLNL